MDVSAAAEFVQFADQKLAQQSGQILRCAGLLSTAELWQRPNEHVNSVANLILHLTGNVTQWIVAGVGGAAFDRNRPAEFAARSGDPAAVILPPLERAVAEARRIIRACDAASLSQPRIIQGYSVLTVAAIFHVVEHFCFHTGQIIHATKWLKNVDLSLYDARGQRLHAADGRP